MFFHALTFAVARGSCLNPRPPGRGFKLLPRDTAEKHMCVFHALTFAVARGSCLNPRPPGRGLV